MPNRRSSDETARLGDEIYEREIRSQVEADHRGEYVAVDVDARTWAIASDPRTAAEQLRARQPDAVNVWLLRVGYRVIASIGGGSLRRAG